MSNNFLFLAKIVLFWMLLQGLKEAINYDVFIVQHGKAVAVYGSSPKGIHLREQAFRKPIQTEHGSQWLALSIKGVCFVYVVLKCLFFQI